MASQTRPRARKPSKRQKKEVTKEEPRKKKKTKGNCGCRLRSSSNPWIEHVQRYRSAHKGCTYAQALKGASASYRSLKPFRDYLKDNHGYVFNIDPVIDIDDVITDLKKKLNIETVDDLEQKSKEEIESTLNKVIGNLYNYYNSVHD